MEEDPEYIFRFPDPGEVINPPIIGFTDVSFGYSGIWCGCFRSASLRTTDWLLPGCFHALDYHGFGLNIQNQSMVA
jgi:hypothetical protein